MNREQLFRERMNGMITEEFLNWLRSGGFFVQAASTKYHGAYEGGLFDHSLAVTDTLLSMTDRMNLKWQNERSPYIIGMFHDLCKIDAYKMEVVDEGTLLFGLDEPEDREVEFSYNENTMLQGHGEKSIMLLSQFMSLTEEEVLCIRFHMGAYKNEDWNGYDKAIRKYENVLWTHHADMYASKVLNC